MGVIRVSDNAEKELENYRQKLKDILGLDVAPSMPQVSDLILPPVPEVNIRIIKRNGHKKIKDLI